MHVLLLGVVVECFTLKLVGLDEKLDIDSPRMVSACDSKTSNGDSMDSGRDGALAKL